MCLCYYKKLSVTIIEIHQVIMKRKFNSENQQLFCRVRVAHVFSFLCCPIMCLYVLSPSCDVRCDCSKKNMFCSSLPSVVCRKAHVLFTFFVFVCA